MIMINRHEVLVMYVCYVCMHICEHVDVFMLQLDDNR